MKTNKKPPANKKRCKEVEDNLVKLLQDGETYSQACKFIGVHRTTVNSWRDKDKELDDRLLKANMLGTIIMDDNLIGLYEDVMAGRQQWTKEQVAAMRDYSQHLRWRASKFYPRLFGDKGIAEVKKDENGITRISWISNGKTSDKALPETIDATDTILVESKVDSG